MEELEDSKDVPSLEKELEAIQQRQVELQARIDAAHSAQAQKIAAAKETAIAKQKSDKAAQQIAEMSAAKKKREEAAEEEAQILAELTRRRLARQAEEKAELERVNAERDKQLAQRKAQADQEAAERKAQAAKQAAIAEARAHAARLEHELRMSMATLEQEIVIAENTEEKPKTLSDGPLAIIFGKGAQVQQDQGLSYAEQTALVRAKEAKNQADELVRKLKPTPEYDTSALLEKLLAPVLGYANPSQCDHFASIYNQSPLLRTTQLIIATSKGTMACNSFWSILEVTLEQAAQQQAEEKAKLAMAETLETSKAAFDAEVSSNVGK